MTLMHSLSNPLHGYFLVLWCPKTLLWCPKTFSDIVVRLTSYRGMICIGQKRFPKALELLHNVCTLINLFFIYYYFYTKFYLMKFICLILYLSGCNSSYVLYECYSCWSIQKICSGFTHSPWAGRRLTWLF